MIPHLLAWLPMLVLFAGCSSHYVSRMADETIALHVYSPGAQQILFYHSLDGFAPRPLTENSYHYWTVQVESSEQFSYFYRIDGEVFIPECEYREPDDFGRFNCVYMPSL